MKKNIIQFGYTGWIILLVSLMAYCPALANVDSPSQPVELEVKIRLVDPLGNPVLHALAVAPNGSFSPSKEGELVAMVAQDALLIIQAVGFRDLYIDLAGTEPPDQVTLYPIPLQTETRNMIPLPLQMKEKSRYLTAANGMFEGRNLETSPELMLSNALQGHGLGLVVRMTPGGMANNPADLYVRGLSRIDNNQVITVVDGIERPIEHILPNEIASVSLLKDPTMKILYGARAANGVLMITTKRGDRNQRRINVSGGYGVGMPLRYPEFLDASQYASLYNEARVNDGLTPIYSEKDILGYMGSNGVNDVTYPNVDYYDYFLRPYNNYSRITADFSGGSDNAAYFLMYGYTGATGLEDVGRSPQNDRFNLRGNLDIDISDIVSAHLDMAVNYEKMERSALNHAAVFEALSGHRPNEYPLIIEELPLDSVGNPALGGSWEHYNNLYGGLKYSGYFTDQYFSGQSNMGLDFDFNDYVKGLSAKAYMTFDNYFVGIESLNNQPSVFARQWVTAADGNDSLVFRNVQRTSYDPQLRLSDSENLRNTGFSGSVNYLNTLGDHRLNAALSYLYRINEQVGYAQDIENTNTFLRTSYVYKKRYIAEFVMAYMGSNRFSGDKRHQLFPAGGLAWIIGDEQFIKRFSAINYLKLRVNAGIIGYDAFTPQFLNQNRWQDSGNVSFGDPSGTNQPIVTSSIKANPGLGWEKSREFSVGLEGIAYDHRMSFEFNYFNEYRYDIIQHVHAAFPALYGGIFPWQNWGEVKNQGFEVSLNWNDELGDVMVRVGANYIYAQNKVLQADDVPYAELYRMTIGKPSDAMMGYSSLGLFGRDVALGGHPHQTFGPYGEGDIAYRDLNGDGVIDDRDRKMLGNSFPRHSIGVDLRLSYNNWELFVLGVGQFGFHAWLNNAYYWNRGEGKYSVMSADRYHPENNPTGSYPRLTTTEGTNNFIDSDFWIENAGFFRFKNMELSYTISNKEVVAIPRKMKFYMRGSNLFVLSAIKDLDPEVPNGGLTNYPVLRSVSLGMSVSF